MARYVFETAEEITACDECPFSAFNDMRMWCELMGREVSTDDVDENMRHMDCPLRMLDERDDAAESIVRALLVGKIGAAEAIKRIEEL